MVKFCSQCHNLYLLKVIEDQLVYNCNGCNLIDSDVEKCLMVNEMSSGGQDYPISPNTIYDYTMPRTKTIECPNQTCPSTGQADRPEIIVYQVNHKTLNSGYLCTECLTNWQ